MRVFTRAPGFLGGFSRLAPGPSFARSVPEALDSGAGDYVVKPFNVGELLARVRAVLRRNPSGMSVEHLWRVAAGHTAIFESERRWMGKVGANEQP